PPPQTHPPSLHDALPISSSATATGDKKTHQMAQKPVDAKVAAQCAPIVAYGCRQNAGQAEPRASSPSADSSPPVTVADPAPTPGDRKSTRLNSSHGSISY